MRREACGDEPLGRPRGRTIFVAFVLGLGSGCASDRAGGRDGRGVEGPSPPGSSMRGPSGTTLGTDRNAVPRGETIPPPSLGVDLVKAPSDAAEETRRMVPGSSLVREPS